MNDTRRIDAHMHWWSIERRDYGWLTPDLGLLYRDFGPLDAAPLLAAAGIDGVILVQAAPTEAETHYLLNLARAHEYVWGVVGWVELTDCERLRTLAREAPLVAIRPMLQDLPAVDWILRPELAPALRLLEELDLPFEALVLPQHLPVIGELLARHPRLRVLIDHGAKPPIASRRVQPWRDDLAAVAASPNVVCKLSGLATEAGGTVTCDDIAPYVEIMFDVFGAGRVIWGSDWPVLTQSLDYATWVTWSEALTGSLPEADRAAVFGGNAASFYGLN